MVRLYERYRSIKDSISMFLHESHVFLDCGLKRSLKKKKKTARITHFKLRNVTTSIIAKEGSKIITLLLKVDEHT